MKKLFPQWTALHHSSCSDLILSRLVLNMQSLASGSSARCASSLPLTPFQKWNEMTWGSLKSCCKNCFCPYHSWIFFLFLDVLHFLVDSFYQSEHQSEMFAQKEIFTHVICCVFFLSVYTSCLVFSFLSSAVSLKLISMLWICDVCACENECSFRTFRCMTGFFFSLTKQIRKNSNLVLETLHSM